MASSAKRMRGLAIHRSILIGNTATPLTDAERHLYPPDHTHKWTVAVRSAATNPLPNIPNAEQQAAAAAARSSSAVPLSVGTPASGSRNGTPAPAEGGAAAGTRPAGSATPAATGMSTRGRDHETDYHKMVGGKDDISHFIKRVQFKLHETYPQATRNIDKPPFQVTETGWGEFDIQIKIFFVPESGEKPLSTFHRLKLHPWHPVTVSAPDAPMAVAASEDGKGQTLSNGGEGELGGDDITMAAAETIQDPTNTTVKPEEGAASSAAVHETRAQSAAAHALPPRAMPPVVHSWSYDEIVFPEPLEPFYETLVSNPPTPLPGLSAQAYSDPTAFRMYRSALEKLDSTSGPSGRDMHAESGIRPPHPLHDPSGALFDSLSQEAVLGEAQRLDKARHSAVHELEDTRSRLIDAEKRVRELRPRLAGAA